MNRSKIAAILLCLYAFAAALYYSETVFERVPHIEDELAYVWQARVIAGGQVMLPSPPCQKCLLVPFVVDYQGNRFGKYPLGWPVVLAGAVDLGARHLVNPILAALCIWLTYRLTQKLFDEPTALLAALLMLVSPFFLINAATLLSHLWSLFLSLAFTLAWLDTFALRRRVPRWLTGLTAAFSLGVLTLTRPLTAASIALPFFVHGIWLLIRGDNETRRAVVGIGALTALIASLLFAWQFLLTGNPLINPYTLWWPYDQLGFGPGHGLQKGGYRLIHAVVNAKANLWVGQHDLFGWGRFSWVLLPFGLFAARRNPRAWLVSAIFPALVLGYGLYWIGAELFGPRYYFEALFSLCILSAAGMRWLAGWPFRQALTVQNMLPYLRFTTAATLLALGIIFNLTFYLPQRMHGLSNLNEMNQAALAPFLTKQAQSLTPAVVIVHLKKEESWVKYGRLLELSSPYLDSPFIITLSQGAQKDQITIDTLPNRTVWHYYPDTPNQLYPAPRQ